MGAGVVEPEQGVCVCVRVVFRVRVYRVLPVDVDFWCVLLRGGGFGGHVCFWFGFCWGVEKVVLSVENELVS